MSETKTPAKDFDSAPDENWEENWRKIQSNLYQEGISIIEFHPNDEADRYWALHLDLAGYESYFKDKEKPQGVAADINQELPNPNQELKQIFHAKFQGTPTFWKMLKAKIISKGFFLPTSELNRFSNKSLGFYSRYAAIFQKDFLWINYIRKIKETSDLKIHADLPLAIIGLWAFFRESIPYYKKLIKKKGLELESIHFVLEEQLDLSGFKDKCSFEQYFLILQTALRKEYFPEIGNTSIQALVDIADPEIQKYWAKYRASIKHFCAHGFNYSLHGNKQKKQNFHRRNLTFYPERDISKSFFQLYQEDIKKMKVLEILDDFHGKNFKQFLPPDIALEYEDLENESAIEKIQEDLENSSVVDRINSSADQQANKQTACYHSPALPWKNEKTLKWGQIPEEKRIALLNQVKRLDTLVQFRSLAQNRLDKRLCNLLNLQTGPIMRWEMQDHLCLPKWNILELGISTLLSANFEEKKEREAKERHQLDELLDEVKSAQELTDIKALLAQFIHFSIPSFQEEWTYALATQKKAIKNRISVRINSMIEYGIIEHPSQANKNTAIWLDEMIQIEKEVSPYVGFVKNIFQSALPNRKTTEFNPYRHSSDGIEFDPDTVQDQNKWMSGEVMKTLRTKVTIGEVVQINAFALDASGSMDHERMRNLFKILYLLVLGLEDRKSYDAFHFFGTRFIEGSNFSSQYTNRSLLFSVLTKIAKIKYKKILYAGGGGTNMSEGIKQCHLRINEFSKILEKENPEANYLKSIFVITDGEPSVGIVNREKLQQDIQQRREDGKLAINGIYIKENVMEKDNGPPVYHGHDELFELGTRANFMEEIFGKDNYVESNDFGQAISDLVYVMSLTYKKQRKVFKQEQRLRKIKAKH